MPPHHPGMTPGKALKRIDTEHGVQPVLPAVGGLPTSKRLVRGVSLPFWGCDPGLRDVHGLRLSVQTGVEEKGNGVPGPRPRQRQHAVHGCEVVPVRR